MIIVRESPRAALGRFRRQRQERDVAGNQQLRRDMPLQTLHRSRDRLVAEWTTLINQLRAILLEAGDHRSSGQTHARTTSRHLAKRTGCEGAEPTDAILIADVRAQWLELDRRIAAFDREFAAFAK
jgi:transposase